MCCFKGWIITSKNLSELLKLVQQNFWIQVYILIMVYMTLTFTEKQSNLHAGHRKFLKGANVVWYEEIYIDLSTYLQILVRKQNLFLTNMRKLIILNILVIKQFQDQSNQLNIGDFDDYIIPANFFDIPKSFILIKLPFYKIVRKTVLK